VPLRALAAIFVTALLIRVCAVLVAGPRLGGDSMSYVSRASQLVDGGVLAVLGLPIESAPLYSVLLVPSLIAGIDSGWYAALAQAVLGAATAALVARFTARATQSELAGALAGLLAAVHLTFVFWGVYLLSDSLFIFVLAVTADRLLVLDRSRRPLLDALVAGSMMLVSVASRPTAAPFAIGLIGFAAVVAHRRLSRCLLLIAGLALPALVVVGVWLAAAGLGRARSPLDAGAQVANWAQSAIYVGLIWTEEGRATFGVDVGVDPPPAVARMTADQEEAFWRLNTSQRPFDFIAAHPAWFSEQAARKAVLFWAPALPEYSATHRAIRIGYFVPLYALAALGLVTAARRAPAFTSLVAIAILAFLLTCMVTFVDYDQRYRLPAELFIIPLAGFGLAWLLRAGYRLKSGVGRPPPEERPMGSHDRGGTALQHTGKRRQYS